MKQALLASAFLLASVGVLGAQTPSTPLVSTASTAGEFPVDRVVAIVGDTPITWFDVLDRVNVLRAQGQKLPTDSAGQMAVARDVLNSLINEELLIQKAKAEKVEVDENDVTRAVDDQYKRLRGQFSSDEALRTELRSGGFGSVEEWRKWVADQQRRAMLQQKLFEKLKQENKLPTVPVTDAEIQQFFEENKGTVPPVPASVSFRQIVLAPKPSPAANKAAYAKAESLYTEIKKGGDFEQIAKRESMDPGSKELGGDLGWHRRGDLVPEFERVMFSLPPGQMSPPVETAFGWHIIKVDRVQPGEVKVRHILIQPKIDSADVARSHALADSIATLWRSGKVSYDSLVAKYHDPSEERGTPQPFPRAQLPQSYQDAFKDEKQGDVTVFPIDDKSRGVPKFVIAQLTEVVPEHEASLADFRQQIKENLTQQRTIQRYLEELRKQTFVAIKL